MQSGARSLPGRGDRHRILNSRARRLATGLFATVVFVHLLCRPKFETDTLSLIHESYRGFACLKHGGFGHCVEAGQFPLFQMGPAMLAAALGMPEEIIPWIFAYASLAAFGISLWIFTRVVPALASFAILIYLSGFAIVYSSSSFTEMAASTFGLAMVATALASPRPARPRSAWWSAGFLLIAALAKETAAPLLFVLGITAQWTRRVRTSQSSQNNQLTQTSQGNAANSHPFWVQFGSEWRAGWRSAMPLACATAVGIGLNCGFNYFKFGSPLNAIYLQPLFRVHDLATTVSYFFGIWISPLGGLWFYWPSLFALLPAIPLELWRSGARPSRWIPWFGVASVLLIATVGFSRWYAPFGWVAWGPRLLLPWLPPCLLVLCFAYTDTITSLLNTLHRYPRATRLLLAVIALSAFANFRIVLYRSFINDVLATALDQVTGCTDATIQKDIAHYHDCLRNITWSATRPWPLRQVFGFFPRPDIFVLSAIFAGGWLEYAIALLKNLKQGTDSNLN